MTLQVNPSEIKAKAMSSGGSKAATTKDFNAFLGGMNAMGDATVQGVSYGGYNNAAAVLSAAFSGTSTYNGLQGYGYGGGMPASYGGGYSAMGSMGGVEGLMGVGTGKYSSPYDPGGTATSGEAVPGTGVNTGELINTMNTNNLKLLELQALMQSNMQQWTTKSNILSTHHKACMTMVEKLNTR